MLSNTKFFTNRRLVNDADFDISTLRREQGVYTIQLANDKGSIISSCMLINFAGGYTYEGLQLKMDYLGLHVRYGYSTKDFVWKEWKTIVTW